MTDDPDQVFRALTASIGAPTLTGEEITAVLRLAKVVADASERRFAPLTCYAAGLVIGASGATDSDRLTRLQALIDQVD